MFCVCIILLAFLHAVHTDTSPPLREYIHVPGKFIAPIPGNSMKFDRDVTLETCAAKCTIYFKTNQFPCYAFEYTTGSKMCVYTNMTTLMKENGFLSLNSNANGVDYYERSKASYKNLFREIPHAALRQQSSYFLVKQNTTLENCARFCHISHAQTCMSFSYSKSMGACGLSSKFWVKGNPNGISLMSTNKYDHYQYYTAWPCNATLPSDYNPHAVASPKFPYLSVTNIDCHLIIEARAGQTIAMKIPTFFTNGDMCSDGENGLTIYDGRDDSSSIVSRLCNSNMKEMVILNSTSNYMYIRYKTGRLPLAFKAIYDFVSAPKLSNPCQGNLCKNGASCVNISSTAYTCTCVKGFSGRFCEANINDCDPQPCYFGGTCVDKINDYHCQCPHKFSGKRCEHYQGMCADNPCLHGVCHVQGRDGYSCHCDNNYTGRNCSIHIPACNSNPCVHGACVNIKDSYICNCPSEYTGVNCESLAVDPCASSPCANGQCVISGTRFMCQCSDGFTGDLCNIVIDNCKNVTCNHGTCLNELKGYRCLCNVNYTGSVCDIKLNACVDTDCGHGTCKLTASGYRCVCDNGFRGSSCQQAEHDFCVPLPCVYGNCTNLPDGYLCQCETGYKGINCDTTEDHCQGQSCGSGICLNSQYGYRCMCAQGYFGQRCDRKVTTQAQAVCASMPCRNGGSCVPKDQTFTCLCKAPFGGAYCQLDYSACLSNPCYGESTCSPFRNSYICICPPGMTGSNCNVSSACASNPCHVGQCTENNGSYKCHLPGIIAHSNVTSTYQG